MIVITGSAGFIASNLVAKLNHEGFKDIVLVDDFSRKEKSANFENKIYSEKVERKDFFNWIEENERFVQFIFHMGARSATTGFPKEVYDALNLDYSKAFWEKCVKYGLPMVYASSAATYGLGEYGYEDNHEIVEKIEREQHDIGLC